MSINKQLFKNYKKLGEDKIWLINYLVFMLLSQALRKDKKII